MATKKVITTNKKAYHDYFVTDTYEAGVELCERRLNQWGRLTSRDLLPVEIGNHRGNAYPPMKRKHI